MADEPNSRRIIFPAIAALPDLALGLLCLTAWVAPGLIGIHWVRDVVLLMLMEFIVIHSSAFMGVAGWGGFGGKVPRSLAIVGFGLFYSLFVGAWAFMFKTWAPLVGFWGLTLNRLLGSVIFPIEGQENQMMKTWASCTFFYLIAVFATTLLPLPALGVTPEVIAAADVPGDSGLWVTRPYTVVAAGFLYYTACALSELTSYGRMVKVKEVTAQRSKAGG